MPGIVVITVGKEKDNTQYTAHISTNIATYPRSMLAMSNAIDSYLVFMPNVASIVHCKVGDDLDAYQHSTVVYGWDTNWINHEVVGHADVGKTQVGRWAAMEELVQYLLMRRRNQFATFNTGSPVMMTTIDDSSNVRQNTTINQEYNKYKGSGDGDNCGGGGIK